LIGKLPNTTPLLDFFKGKPNKAMDCINKAKIATGIHNIDVRYDLIQRWIFNGAPVNKLKKNPNLEKLLKKAVEIGIGEQKGELDKQEKDFEAECRFLSQISTLSNPQQPE
jgi:hypothetical protein